MQDVVRSSQSHTDLCVPLFVQKIHSRKLYGLSFLAQIYPPSINPEFVVECKLIAHPMW